MNNTAKPRMRAMFNLAYDRVNEPQIFFRKNSAKMEDSMRNSTKDQKHSTLKKMLLSLTFSRGSSGRTTKSSAMDTASNALQKSKSCNCSTTTSKTSSSLKDDHHQKDKKKKQVNPHGCFSVYVGQEKQKFVIKTECANHPLFKMLLEDAESEYGFSNEGPILIPCDVDLFHKVLAEMDSGKEIDYGCGFAYGSCSPFNPTRRLGRNSDMAKGYGSYGALIPSRLLK